MENDAGAVDYMAKRYFERMKSAGFLVTPPAGAEVTSSKASLGGARWKFFSNGLNEGSEKMKGLPSGKRLHNYGKSPFSSWIYPLKIVIFHSYVSVPEGTQTWQTWIDWQFSIKFDDLSLEMPIEFRDFPAGHVWLRRAGWWDRKMPSESGNFIGMGSMIQCVTMMGKSEKPFKEVLVDHPK